MSTWVRTFEQGAEYVEDLGGIDWATAPRPRRWHRCSPQTRGIFGDMFDRRLVERCRCGALRVSGGSWLERNSR